MCSKFAHLKDNFGFSVAGELEGGETRSRETHEAALVVATREAGVALILDKAWEWGGRVNCLESSGLGH